MCKTFQMILKGHYDSDKSYKLALNAVEIHTAILKYSAGLENCSVCNLEHMYAEGYKYYLLALYWFVGNDYF